MSYGDSPEEIEDARLMAVSVRSRCATVDAAKAIHEHLSTWGPHCGAPRSVFAGHLKALIMALIKNRDLSLNDMIAIVERNCR